MCVGIHWSDTFRECAALRGIWDAEIQVTQLMGAGCSRLSGAASLVLASSCSYNFFEATHVPVSEECTPSPWHLVLPCLARPAISAPETESGDRARALCVDFQQAAATRQPRCPVWACCIFMYFRCSILVSAAMCTVDLREQIEKQTGEMVP